MKQTNKWVGCCGCGLAAVVVVVMRGINVEIPNAQLLCVKARRRDATAVVLYAGVVVCVLSRLFLACVIMAMWDTTRAAWIQGCYGTSVIDPAYSGAKSDFECLPDLENASSEQGNSML